jgi:hypothetical protein
MAAVHLSETIDVPYPFVAEGCLSGVYLFPELPFDLLQPDFPRPRGLDYPIALSA